MADASSTGSLDELLRSLQEEQKKQPPVAAMPPAREQSAAPANTSQVPPVPVSVGQDQLAARRTQKSDVPFQRKKIDIASLPPLGGKASASQQKQPSQASGALEVKEESIPVPQGQKTIIRTMAQDIASAGSGGVLSTGTPMEAPVVPSTPSRPKPQEAAQLPSEPSLTAPAPQVQPASTHHGRVSSRTIAYVVVTAIALGAGAAYWISQSPEASRMIPRESKMPETLPIPSGERQQLSVLLGGALETVTLSGEVSGTSIHDAASSLLPAPQRLRRFQIAGLGNEAPVSHPRDIFDALGVVRPSEIDAMWGEEGAILAFGQPSIFNSRGVLVSPPPTQETRLILIGEVLDVAQASAAMDVWRATGVDKSLADLLRYDILKASTPDIQTGTYKSYTIHYKNFPYSDRALDYALADGPDGRAYLLFANSKEAMSAALDLFHAQASETTL